MIEKIGVAIGVTDELVDKFDAVKLVKEAAEILRWERWWWQKRFCSSWWSK